MKICRYLYEGSAHYGIIENDIVYAAEGEPFSKLVKGQVVGTLPDITLTVPVEASKVVCIGRNYADHIEEMGRTVLTEPLVFYKPVSSLIGPGKAIELMEEMGKVDFEAELAVVIGKRARHVSAEDAPDYVLGYTCANDITDRDYQNSDKQWWRAKGFDTFGPVGPWIETELDPNDLHITCTLNGEVMQDASTHLMLFNTAELIAFVTRAITLEPGDLLLTGTPAGVGQMQAGDVVTVTIEGIGELTNPVRDAQPH